MRATGNRSPFSLPGVLQETSDLFEVLPSVTGFDSARDIDGGRTHLTHGLGHVFRCETAGEDDLAILPETHCLGA